MSKKRLTNPTYPPLTTGRELNTKANCAPSCPFGKAQDEKKGEVEGDGTEQKCNSRFKTIPKSMQISVIRGLKQSKKSVQICVISGLKQSQKIVQISVISG